MKSNVKRSNCSKSRRRKTIPGKVGGETTRGRNVRDVRQAEETVRPAVRSSRGERSSTEAWNRAGMEVWRKRETAAQLPRPDMTITESDAGTMYRFTTLRGVTIETFIPSHKYLRTIEKFRDTVKQ